MLDIIGWLLNGLAVLIAFSLFLPLGAWLLPALRPMALGLGKIYHAINAQTHHLVMWLAIFMALVQLLVVILRYIYGVNFIWMQQSITYMFAFLFLLSAGYALIQNEHVRVDVFYRNASDRFKARVDILGSYFFLLPVCCLIIWASGAYVAQSWAIMERSTEASGIHSVFLLKSLIPVFAALLLMSGYVLIQRSLEILGTKAEAV